MAGAWLPPLAVTQIHTAANYIRIGRWMRDHGCKFQPRVGDKRKVWDAIASRVAEKNVLYLEFGVAKGASMRYWSSCLKHPASNLHGFDSFEGLPEAAGPWTKGQFNTDGRIPQIPDPRVRFFKGWFNETLPTYSLPPHEALVVNMDADLYSSTIYVLRHLRQHFKPGSFLYFDEMNHVDHEPRAFDEFVAESRLEFRPLCADKTLAFVSFECVRA